MYKKLALAALAGVSHAGVWPATDKNVTASWPSNNNSVRSSKAGAIFTFDSPANMIVNGTGSCDVTINTAGLSFIHFFNADVALQTTQNVFTVYAMGGWEDQGQFSFLAFGDDEPTVDDLSVECQNDTPVPDNTAVLSSFPRDPMAKSTRGSFTIMNKELNSDDHKDYTNTVVMDFGAGMAPANFTLDDTRLVVTQTGDSFAITGLDNNNFQDVWFGMDYARDVDDNPIIVASYEITITVV